MSAISSRHVRNVHARPDIAIGAPLIHCRRHSVCSRSVEGRIDHAAQGNGAGCRPVLVEAPAPSAQSMPSLTRHVCVDPPEPPSSSPSRISRDVHAKPALLCNCQGGLLSHSTSWTDTKASGISRLETRMVSWGFQKPALLTSTSLVGSPGGVQREVPAPNAKRINRRLSSSPLLFN